MVNQSQGDTPQPSSPKQPPGGLNLEELARARAAQADRAKMSFRKAPFCAAVLIFMIAIELLIFLGGRVLGVADLAPTFDALNLLRESVLSNYAFLPIYMFDSALGSAGLTLVTSIFLHAGLLHLLANGAMLAALGPPVERAFGSWRFMALFIASGVLGGLAHFVYAYGLSSFSGGLDPLLIGLVGASGAISGVMGAELTRRAEILRRIPAEFQTERPEVFLGKTVLILVLLNVAISILEPMISGAAHIGGILAGVALGLLFGFSQGLGFIRR